MCSEAVFPDAPFTPNEAGKKSEAKMILKQLFSHRVGARYGENRRGGTRDLFTRSSGFPLGERWSCESGKTSNFQRFDKLLLI